MSFRRWKMRSAEKMTKKNTFSALENLKELSVSPGAVYIGPWANIDHEKFLIVAGIDQDKILVCSVMINSRINQYIMKRPKMLACQLELKKADYDFLSPSPSSAYHAPLFYDAKGSDDIVL